MQGLSENLWFPREMTSEEQAEKFQQMLMTCHYLHLGSASDWSCCEGNLLQPIRSTAQIWIVTRHQYGISALNPQTLFAGEPVMALRNVGRFLRLVKASSPHAITLLVQLVSRFPLSARCRYISRKNCVISCYTLAVVC